MGVNLFVEGRPEPVILTVQLEQEVTDFMELRNLADALSGLSNYLKNDWPELWPDFGDRRFRDVRLINFKKESPPVFEIFADPAWIAVLLAVLIGYKAIKENVKEMHRDISQAIMKVQGITERERELLGIAIHLTINRLGELRGEARSKVVRRLEKIAHRLKPETERTPAIKVVNLDKRRFW